MWFLSLYRLYLSVAGGVVAALFLVPAWWFGLLVTIALRAGVAAVEHLNKKITINKLFNHHQYSFKQELGPYGIRMINRAEKDFRLKTSLAEVFVKNEKKLSKAVEQLEMMETLFKSGMQPDADTWQLHDLKLKYGRYRLDSFNKRGSQKDPQK